MHAPSQGASAFACKPQQVMPQRELWHFLFFWGGGRMLLRLRLCLKRYGRLAYRCIAESHKAYVAASMLSRDHKGLLCAGVSRNLC